MKNRVLVARLIFFGVLLIIAAVSEIIISLRVNRLQNDYPRLKINQELTGTVKSIYRPDFIRKSAGTVYITIEDKNIRINTDVYSVPSGQDLDNLLQIGDSIVKRIGSDSIFLYDYNSKELEYVYKLLRPDK